MRNPHDGARSGGPSSTAGAEGGSHRVVDGDADLPQFPGLRKRCGDVAVTRSRQQSWKPGEHGVAATQHAVAIETVDFLAMLTGVEVPVGMA